jgi:co-chaperonin GroES (HSP10)
MSDVRPLNDVVVVQLDPPEKLSSLIEAPDTVAQRIRKATVLRVGPGREQLVNAQGTKARFLRNTLKPGERVAFFSAAVDTQKANFYLEDGQALIREQDVLFVLEEDCRVEAP